MGIEGGQEAQLGERACTRASQRYDACGATRAWQRHAACGAPLHEQRPLVLLLAVAVVGRLVLRPLLHPRQPARRLVGAPRGLQQRLGRLEPVAALLATQPRAERVEHALEPDLADRELAHLVEAPRRVAGVGELVAVALEARGPPRPPELPLLGQHVQLELLEVLQRHAHQRPRGVRARRRRRQQQPLRQRQALPHVVAREEHDACQVGVLRDQLRPVHRRAVLDVVRVRARAADGVRLGGAEDPLHRDAQPRVGHGVLVALAERPARERVVLRVDVRHVHLEGERLVDALDVAQRVLLPRLVPLLLAVDLLQRLGGLLVARTEGAQPELGTAAAPRRRVHVRRLARQHPALERHAVLLLRLPQRRQAPVPDGVAARVGHLGQLGQPGAQRGLGRLERVEDLGRLHVDEELRVGVLPAAAAVALEAGRRCHGGRLVVELRREGAAERHQAERERRRG